MVDAEGGYEIMRCTERAGEALTVVRAQEGTEARSFDAGARVELRLTAAVFADVLAQALVNTSTVTGETVADALNTLLSQKLDASAIDLQAKWSCGDVKLTYKTVADPGWIMIDDGSIGNAASNATTRAHADTEPLFLLAWNIDAALAPLQDSAGNPVSRGGTAAADFAANRRLVLAKALGRVIGIAGAGSGLTSRALGFVVGAETHTTIIDEMPEHNHEITQVPHAHGYDVRQTSNVQGGGGGQGAGGLNNSSTSGANANITINNRGGGDPHNNMQPTTFMNAMIML